MQNNTFYISLDKQLMMESSIFQPESFQGNQQFPQIIYQPFSGYSHHSTFNLSEKDQVNNRSTQNQIVPLKKRVYKLKSNQRRKKQSKISKNKKKSHSGDYRKNICGYIIKKAIRQFISTNYSIKVKEICNNLNISYSDVVTFYSQKMQSITGPSHIPLLIIPSNKDESAIKKSFFIFVIWFLNERYARHIILQGKMDKKQIYIEYKNKQLVPLLISMEKNINKELQYNFSTSFELACEKYIQ